MRHTSEHFIENSRIALADAQLRPVLGAVSTFLPALRQAAIDQTPEFEALRDYAIAMKDHVLDHLETYLVDFGRAVEARGGTVHHAAGPEDLNRIVLALCESAGARKVIKGKSMVGEETNLNDALHGAGLEVLETDLGEYIIQQANEPPSHIIGPALHKSKAQVAQLFREKHDLGERDLGDVPQNGSEFPPLVLADCDESLVDGAPDLRGTWRVISATRGGEPVSVDDRLLTYRERIEQCGNRIVDCGGGTIADARADGTEENGVHDVSVFDYTTPIHVVASYEDGAFVLRPVGLPGIEVRRWLDEEGHMIWTRPDMGGIRVVLEREPTVR